MGKRRKVLQQSQPDHGEKKTKNVSDFRPHKGRRMPTREGKNQNQVTRTQGKGERANRGGTKDAIKIETSGLAHGRKMSQIIQRSTGTKVKRAKKEGG